MDKWTESVRRGCVVFNPSWRGLVQAGHASSHIYLTSLHKADRSFMTGINTAAGAISQVRPRGSLQVNPAGVGKTNGARQDSGVPSDMKHRSGYERRPGSVEHKAVRQICANQSMIGSAMSRRVNNFIDSPWKSGRFFFYMRHMELDFKWTRWIHLVMKIQSVRRIRSISERMHKILIGRIPQISVAAMIFAHSCCFCDQTGTEELFHALCRTIRHRSRWFLHWTMNVYEVQ